KLDDGNMYITNATQIPLAALFGPIRRSDTGPGGFYKYAANGDTGLGLTFGGGADDNNIYDFENYRADNNPLETTEHDKVVIQSIATVSGEFQSLTCADGKGFHLKQDYPPPSRATLPATCYKGALGVGFQENSTQLLRLSRAKEVLDTGEKNLDDQYS